MGEVERYPDGTFCWIDLGTTEVAGARAFYGGLLGWEFEDLPAPEGAVLADPAGGEFTAAHVPAGARRGVDGS